MIKIEYKEATPKYDQYISDFKEWIERKLNRSSFSGIWRNNNVDPDTAHFLNWLLVGNNLSDLCNATPSDLQSYISQFETRYPDLKLNRLRQPTTGDICKDLKLLFVTHGYSDGFQMDKMKYSINKDELHDATGVEVCPYCNRIYIRKQAIKNNKKTVKAELDHFYSKELFPYLAICKYNLVPSCSFCNGRAGKYIEDAYKGNMQNPYGIIDNDADLSFRLKIKNKKIVNMQTASQGLSIKMIPATDSMRKNIEVFNLEPLYNHHTDHAAELLLKSRINNSKPYRSFLKNRFKQNGIELTDAELNRILIGNYTEQKDYGKRPLAKLYHDIALELGLIKQNYYK